METRSEWVGDNDNWEEIKCKHECMTFQKFCYQRVGPSQCSVQVFGVSSNELNEMLRESSEQAVY